MNSKVKIIGIFLIAILIVWLAYKKLGKGWGIGIGIVLGALLWFGMTWSMGGPNGWQTLFGTNKSGPAQSLQPVKQ